MRAAVGRTSTGRSASEVSGSASTIRERRLPRQARLAALLLVALGCGDQIVDNTPPDTEDPEEPGTYTLVWSDEFDADGLPDPDLWGYDVGDGCPNLCGWGNDELQYYTETRLENARVEGGSLLIEARKEPFGSREYTSARLVTKGKGDWRYGKIEIRAQLPSGVGTWPAIWMLSSGNSYGAWPASGEIDIMEHVGFAPDSVFAAVHTAAYNHMLGTQRTGRTAVPDAERAFHVYAMEWTETRIDFYIDDVRFHSFLKEGPSYEVWPFDQPFHLILNIAVGGSWGGSQGVDESIWPQRMLVDYIRVYQLQ
jgi:beta-glucanase (GH16 family)